MTGTIFKFNRQARNGLIKPTGWDGTGDTLLRFSESELTARYAYLQRPDGVGPQVNDLVTYTPVMVGVAGVVDYAG